jgi:hypothetical protein
MDDAARFETELKILRLILYRASAVESPNPLGGDLSSFLDQLTDYEWTDHEHRVVYECLRIARRSRVALLGTQMASVATRLGHPDVDWDSYFGQPTEHLDLVDLIERLKRNSL